MSGPSFSERDACGDSHPVVSEARYSKGEDSTKESEQEESAAHTIPISQRRGSHDGTCVQVAVRVRPLLHFERHEAATDCVTVFASEAGSLSNTIQLGGASGPKFTFDQVFDSDIQQSTVFEDRIAPLVDNCLEGYNATVLAYGQTGSGKTHTIMGPPTSLATAMLSEEEREQTGVIPRAIRSIFHQLQLQAAAKNATTGDDSSMSFHTTTIDSPIYEYEVRLQFLEVYGEDIRDLLNTQHSTATKLSIRDVGNEEPEVVGASEQKVESADEALLCLTRGMYRRVTASTAMNESSSRSHAILSLIVEQTYVLDEDSSEDSDGNETRTEGAKKSPKLHVQTKKSKFNFVDLAGSERQKRTQSSGQRLREGIDINKGLLVLGNVISALGDPKKQGKAFVPYRDSKLTRLLKGSLGGNHKTLMIACVSPSSSNAEETLNCLRYANRAKNIQNHAVVNVDATSALVADLKVKVQRLAYDLMKARTGNISECSIPLTVLESLVKGAEDSEYDRWLNSSSRHTVSPSPRISQDPRFEDGRSTAVATGEFSGSSFATSLLETRSTVKESLCVQIISRPRCLDTSEAFQAANVAKTTVYEREIDLQQNMLARKSKARGRNISGGCTLLSLSRAESPELSRLKSQMFGSLSKFSTLDAEVEAEERSVIDLSEKYLSLDNDVIEEEDLEARCDPQNDKHDADSEEHTSLFLEADLFALSSSISAKEELIIQLQSSQEKYECMRDFYEEKLKEMEELLLGKVTETEKLSEELKKHDVSNVQGRELSEKLKQKRAQVLELQRKQAELVRLTTAASRNESQISKLKDEVREMKNRKMDLQKTLTSERKSHNVEVRQLKKESMKKDRELNKVKQENIKMSHETSRAQNVAKSRLDQINHLKTKYKDTEKRLRMQTIKHGILVKAGLNPVMVGRRQSCGAPHTGTPNKCRVNMDRVRDLFDQKVADVSRREHLAFKVAQEWEEHFDLTSQKELLENDGDNDESIRALESQIRYREERIRSIASRLGKQGEFPRNNDSVSDDAFLFNEEFDEIVGDVSSAVACRTAATVLFGMVVRERRRIASLAKTASQLDEKVQEVEAAAAAKDAAFRAYIDEQRLEAARIAQNQQEHILTLMEMVKETPDEEPHSNGKVSKSGDGNSKLLVLANERIALLECQLQEASLLKDAIQKHREREELARSLFEDKRKECEDLEGEVDDLRSTLRRIREELVRRESSDMKGSVSEKDVLRILHDLVTNTLHPSSISLESSSPRRRSISSSTFDPYPAPKITREAKILHYSDSEEMPDWADDIMADLAIIAEGKIPASLMTSQIIFDAENQINGNVFDRLTDPVSFTGIQKQRNAHPMRPIKSKSNLIVDISKRRELSSQQVTESLGKSTKRESNDRKSKDKRANKTDLEKRSVFDRLLSPSNLTGTHKQKFHDKKGRNLEKAIENQHVTTRSGNKKTSECDSEFDDSEGQDADNLLDELLLNDIRVNDVNEKHVDVSKDHQDVFERLNRTTTAAYAVKQNINIAERMLDELLRSSDSNNHEEEPENPRCELKFERLEEYQKQDVFERLQRTTTEAYAQKKNAPISDDHHIATSPPNNRKITRSQLRAYI